MEWAHRKGQMNCKNIKTQYRDWGVCGGAYATAPTLIYEGQDIALLLQILPLNISTTTKHVCCTSYRYTWVLQRSTFAANPTIIHEYCNETLMLQVLPLYMSTTTKHFCSRSYHYTWVLQRNTFCSRPYHYTRVLQRNTFCSRSYHYTWVLQRNTFAAGPAIIHEYFNETPLLRTLLLYK